MNNANTPNTITTEHDLLCYVMQHMNTGREVRVERNAAGDGLEVYHIEAFSLTTTRATYDEQGVTPVAVDLIPFYMGRFTAHDSGDTLETFEGCLYTQEYYEQDTYLFRSLLIDDILKDLA